MEYAVGTLELRIRVEHSRSLKDKRQVLRSLKDRLAKRHNVAVAEVAHQDSRRDAAVVAVTVATAARQAQEILDAARGDAEEALGRSLLEARSDVLTW